MAETCCVKQNRHRRIGIVGYGSLGQYLVEQIETHADFELAFVWNRSKVTLEDQVPHHLILDKLEDFQSRQVDLIVEVAHPSISVQYGERFLQHADYMVGSPTALADPSVESALRAAASQHGLYLPAGAFWGAEDVRKMADRGTLQGLKITMTKPPACFKLLGALKSMNESVTTDRTVLYDGPVRGLCPLAPHNVNTMAVASVAAHNLGFDRVLGSIVADPNLGGFHLVEVEVWGPGDMEAGTAFHVKTVRKNPANIGSVTGAATYASFLSSLLGAHGRGAGIHLC